jgi:ribose transport system ATP-binding protein
VGTDLKPIATNVAEIARPLVVMRDVVKRFGATQALRGVNLDVNSGEMHALVGPNGAGKSTLIKILSGHHRPDRGTFEVHSYEDKGIGKIGVIHQDLGLVDTMTVRENFHMSRAGGLTRSGFLDAKRERAATKAGLDAVGLDLDPETPLADLGLGVKSLVAVARLLAHDADTLILDEVTAALTRKESEFVLAEMRKVANRGPAIIVVSHRLHEITEHCDHVTVIRDGSVAFSGPTPALPELHALLEKGHEHAFHYEALEPVAQRAPALELRGAIGAGVGPIDLTLEAGEVVGLVGSLSSGLYSIGHLAAGRAALKGGERVLRPREQGATPRCSFVPEDRKSQGILPLLEVSANLTVSAQRLSARGGWISRRGEREQVSRSMQRLAVHPADPDLPIDSLSGGNQQKALMGRVALLEPDLIVLCEPTRGVDVTTRRAIYNFIDEVRRDGTAVLVVTIDIDDAFAVSDRIAVADAGRIVEVMPRQATDPIQLLERLS